MRFVLQKSYPNFLKTPQRHVRSVISKSVHREEAESAHTRTRGRHRLSVSFLSSATVPYERSPTSQDDRGKSHRRTIHWDADKERHFHHEHAGSQISVKRHNEPERWLHFLACFQTNS